MSQRTVPWWVGGRGRVLCVCWWGWLGDLGCLWCLICQCSGECSNSQPWKSWRLGLKEKWKLSGRLWQTKNTTPSWLQFSFTVDIHSIQPSDPIGQCYTNSSSDHSGLHLRKVGEWGDDLINNVTFELDNLLALGATRDCWSGPHRAPGVVKQQTTTWCPLEAFHHRMIGQKLTGQSSYAVQPSQETLGTLTTLPAQGRLESRICGSQTPSWGFVSTNVKVFRSLTQDAKKLQKEKVECVFHEV